MEDVLNKKFALLIIITAAFLIPYLSSAVTVAIPSIGSEFAMDVVLLAWIATSFFLAAAVFLVPFGRIADIYGRKKIFIYGIIVLIISSFLSVLSNSGTVFIIFRIFQGLGSAMVFGTSLAILTSVFPLGERGKAMGIETAAAYIGLSLGPFLGGVLTQNFGWRSIFLLIVPIGLLILAMVFWKLKGEWAEAKGEKLDLTGSFFYGLALVALMYGFSILPETSGILLTSVGVLGMLGFIWWEIRARTPVLNISLFRNNRVFLFSNMAALISYSATFAVVFLISLYLQQIKGLNPQDAGLVLVAQPIVMAISSPFAGRLSDRVEPRMISSIGMALTAVALFMFALLNSQTTLEYVVGILVLIGFGFALFSSPNMNAIMCSVERKFYGVASGMVGTMRLMGQMVSMGIATLVFAILIGRVQITPEYYPLFLSSVNISFIIFAALCFLGMCVSLSRGRLRECSTDS